ncbi:hypothetical protein C9374_003332 [Naegleria lovaniensis]|uniref:Cytoplasmic dynein 2 light intermediate chain 1 n=1 Tax=Naegleria lovaniensis TaxID=51637 RepID=A0AA88GR55_NAELO|nr:uncharacterized protein C9374_003332 [Naegleria lovaniensis]KAG2385517.1 hypothetical protein C9374_003332 [Naegleria lovaniensis]
MLSAPSTTTTSVGQNANTVTTTTPNTITRPPSGQVNTVSSRSNASIPSEASSSEATTPNARPTMTANRPGSASRRPGSNPNGRPPSSAASSVQQRRAGMPTSNASNSGGSPSTNSSSSSTQASRNVKTLWDIILDTKKDAISSNNEPVETNVFIIGGEQSGKSCLVHRILKRDYLKDPPEKSTALDFTFGKKDEGLKTYIANMWELAGGRSLIKLLKETITADNIHTVMAVIVLDLTKPLQLFEDFIYYQYVLTKISDELYDMLRKKGSDVPDKMIGRAKKRIGETHEDIDKLKLHGFQTIFVGTYFDQATQKYNPLQLKQLNQTMRFLCHTFGTSPMFMGIYADSKANENNDSSFRNFINYFVLGGKLSTTDFNLKDPVKPLKVIAGKDSFKNIGTPPVQAKTQQIISERAKKIKEKISKMFDNKEIEKWFDSFQFTFSEIDEGAEDEGNKEVMDLNFSEYAEEVVDEMKAKKDFEFDQYLKMVERDKKQKLLLKQQQDAKQQQKK